MNKSHAGSNDIISGCPIDQHSSLFSNAEYVSMNANEVLQEANGIVRHVFFPHGGLISLLVVLPNGWTVEAGFVGSEGAAGTTYSTTDDRVPRRSFTRSKVVSAGSAFRLPIADFESAMTQSDAFRHRISENNFLVTARAQQAAACNLLHQLEPRLCRWLLQVFENSGNPTVEITQASLSQMLGVNRARLNKALKNMEAVGSISHPRRGEFTMNPSLIADRVCDCYREMQIPNRTQRMLHRQH